MRVLFATAELAPLVTVGGLAEASAGLVKELRAQGVDVDLLLPDYGGIVLDDEITEAVPVPAWAEPASVRRGHAHGFGELGLVTVPGIAREHPYVDEYGTGWPDNADRFFGFSAVIASVAGHGRYDVLHLNDWHTAATLGLMHDPPPTVITAHTMGHQGWTSGGWLDRLVRGVDAYESYGGTNPLAGAAQLADAVVTVSPNYAREVTTPEGGEGLDAILRDRGDALIGIRNGIDAAIWNPSTDPHLARRFDDTSLADKQVNRTAMLTRIGWPDEGPPVVGVVSRLVDQKGIDLVLESARFVERVPFRLVILGSGERWIADWARWVADQWPDHVSFTDGYDATFAHQIFGGADALLMPSRFEPCGLAQMQAMSYGTIPIVAPVGGLVDTVIDADDDRRRGTGFVMGAVDAAGAIEAVHRAMRAIRNPQRRAAIQRRGMRLDWSWTVPAARHVELYEELISRS